MILEPRAQAVPVSQEVRLGQDELERRIGHRACAGRGLRCLIGTGADRPAEDRHGHGNAEPAPGHVLLRSSFMVCTASVPVANAQLALARAAPFPMITSMSSRQEVTKDFAPSSWSRLARASTSTPALAN